MTFQPSSLLEKLSKLNASQQSIETISQWCLFYRKDAKKVVATWEQDFARSQDQDKKLALVYLANDILQNSRRKGPQFVNEFYHKLPAAIRHIVKHGDAKKRSSLARMIQVWDERRVFGTGGAKPFKDLLQAPSGKLPTAAGSLGSKSSGQIANPPVLATATSIGLPELDPLQRLLSGALAAHSRTRELSTRSKSLLSQEASGDLEVLKAGQQQLGELKASLELELSQRQQTLDILRGLTTQQERDVSHAQEALAECDARLAQTQEHISSEAATPTAMSEDVYSPGSAVPAADAAWGSESPPPPPFSPVNGNATEAPNNLPEELPRGDPPEPNPASGGMGDGNGQADTSLEDLLAGFGEGGADVSSAAADLVAQLTGSGGQSAQMLMEALSALPKEDVQMPQQEQEPKDAFVPEEEEYDPEYGL